MCRTLWEIANKVAFLAAKCVIECNGRGGKVLHISNFSHKPYVLTRRLRQSGIEVDYLALNVDWTYLNMGDHAYDYAMLSTDAGKWRYYLKAFYVVWFVLTKYDVIHVHSQSSVTSSLDEYIYMSRLGKRLVFHFRGCDIRSRTRMKGLGYGLNCCQECDYPTDACDNAQQERYLEVIKDIGDGYFCTTPDLLDFAPAGTVYLPFVLPPAELFDGIVPVDREEDLFRVVTSSNHDGVDGTSYVKSAVERLKSDGVAIELVEVKKTPFHDALAVYASADLYAGKLRMGYYNNANIECMLLGVPCASYIRPDLRARYCPDNPIIQATPDTIYEVLREWVPKKEELKRIGRLGREYILAQHSDERTIIPLVECYRQLSHASGDSAA